MLYRELVQNQELVWKEPVIVPKPFYTYGVPSAIMSLDTVAGLVWQFGSGARSIDEVMDEGNDNISWSDIVVPGEPAMQGYDLENDTPYYYKVAVNIPSAYEDNNILLRFNGVYSKASVWVNGIYIRAHKGGFTTWDCDITNQVTPGEEAYVIVEFIDDIWDPSIGSKYAHHNMGGIINSVELIAVPKTHLTKLHYLVDFDPTYTDAELKVMLGITVEEHETAIVQLELKDAAHQAVPLVDSTITCSSSTSLVERVFSIASPAKWDAEHPNLYTLKATIYRDEALSDVVQACQAKVGFRKIAYGGMDGTDKRKVYINGQPIKMRGTCRHHVHPLLGRTTTPEMDREDVLLLKGQNVNYVRTSHYPPTQAFLDACDELGMYVEEETAVNFQYANGPGPWGDDESWYMDQFSEMVERDKSHPSVIIWSLANESGWRAGPEGDKFRKEYQYIKQVDRSRPAKFSYPFQIEDGTEVDIFSVHYPHYSDRADYHRGGYANEQGEVPPEMESIMPVIHDEYAHIACYNLKELERDNNVRNFWGESVQMFWENIVRTDGALGGALWANIDDVFHLPAGVQERHQKHSEGTAAGYGEWGNMSDQWRREKPEYWLTKKAYSPVRVADRPLGNPGHAALVIPIENWFNHSNLQEIQVAWSIVRDNQIVEAGQMSGPDVEPYQQGELYLPVREWADAEQLQLRFIGADGVTIDEYDLPITASTITVEEEEDYGELQVEETAEHIHIWNEMFELVYDKRIAQLANGVVQGETVINRGPQLHLDGEELGGWMPGSIQVTTDNNSQQVDVTIGGSYTNGMKVQFVQSIDRSGLLSTRYKLLECVIHEEQNDYAEILRLHQSPEEKAQAKLSEVGIAFHIPSDITRVSWKKQGLHSVYPANHIGRLEGSAERVRQDSATQPDTYRVAPSWDWKDDMRNFFLEQKDDALKGLVTRDFNTMREYVYTYDIHFGHTNAQVRAESSGTDAARIHYGIHGETGTPQASLIINNAWRYSDLTWGNYEGPVINIFDGYENQVAMRLSPSK